MSLIPLLIILIVFVVIVVLAIFIIDATFTGPLAAFAWVAKIVVGLIALLVLLSYVHSGAPGFIL
jgi:hypothetical protein